ncbi:hypothetical protein [Enterococcus bulliens]
MRKNYLVTSLCIFIFGVFLYINLNIEQVLFNDDLVFLREIAKEYHGNYYDYFLHRYQVWTSRSIIEFVLTFMVQHVVIWKIINALAMTIICIVPSFYVQSKNRIFTLIMSTCFFLLIPFNILKEAGWIATTTNYLWIFATAILVFFPIIKILQNQGVPKSIYGLSLIPLLYAINQEQMLVLVSGFIICIVLYLILNRRNVSFLIPHLVLIACMYIYIFTNPGNAQRTVVETHHYLPEFENFTLFHKFYLGYCTTLKSLFFDFKPFIAMNFFLIAVLSIISNKSTVKKILGFLPLGLYFITVANKNWIDMSFDLISLNNSKLLLVVLSFCLIIYIIGLYGVSESINQFVIVFLLISSAVCVRIILGFSPTVWASGDRTYLFTYLQILLASVFLCSTLSYEKLSSIKKIIFSFYLLLLVCVTIFLFLKSPLF